MCALDFPGRLVSWSLMLCCVFVAPARGEAGPDAVEVSAIEVPASDPATVEVGGVRWLTSYTEAYAAAQESRQMLLINFVPLGESSQQSSLEAKIAADESLRERLGGFTLLRLQDETPGEGPASRLLGHAAFSPMKGDSGVAVLDLASQGEEYSGRVVSAFPYRSGKYYRWQCDYLPVILGLPQGTLSQRTMVWAVRVHPERPASTGGEMHPGIADAAGRHSAYQASIRNQGHHNWGRRSGEIQSMAGTFKAVEVVAESWPNQDLIDSCLDCVASWRHSSGHWGAVRSPHRLYGYDIRRGSNGIWYGTGIFAD